jgi:hypothetical protein
VANSSDAFRRKPRSRSTSTCDGERESDEKSRLEHGSGLVEAKSGGTHGIQQGADLGLAPHQILQTAHGVGTRCDEGSRVVTEAVPQIPGEILEVPGWLGLGEQQPVLADDTEQGRHLHASRTVGKLLEVLHRGDRCALDEVGDDAGNRLP